MRAPGPLPALASAAGWAAGTVAFFPWLVPPVPAYRTLVAAGAVLLFALAVAAPRGATSRGSRSGRSTTWTPHARTPRSSPRGAR